ncbi:MAG: ABC transporter permease [Thermoanaerobaculia bacterium]
MSELLRTAIEALQRHKLRSFLTLLGVIIGVTTVVAVVSVISGLNNYVGTQLLNLSPDVFVATRFGIITSREEFLKALKRKPILLADVQAIEERCNGCAEVGMRTTTSMRVKFRSNHLNRVDIVGGSPNIAELTRLDLEAGRFYTQTEDQHSAPVAVIGWDVRDRLFGQLDPIGRIISISGRKVRVIGLMSKQGSVLGESRDRRVYVPLSWWQKSFGSRQSLAVFIRPAGGISQLQRTEDEVRVILRSRRHTSFKDDDPFSFVTAETVQAAWKSISAGAFALMIFISGISLVVGGIVIMNIMLVSVIERTHEIGIRRALGATRRNIRMQFLLEAVLLALVGGIVGVLLGAMISRGIAMIFPLPTLVRPALIATGLGIAVLTGAAAGYFPARKAASLPPVEALRYE